MCGKQSSSNIIHFSSFSKNQSMALLTANLHPKLLFLNKVFNSHGQVIFFIISLTSLTNLDSIVFLDPSHATYSFFGLPFNNLKSFLCKMVYSSEIIMQY